MVAVVIYLILTSDKKFIASALVKANDESNLLLLPSIQLRRRDHKLAFEVQQFNLGHTCMYTLGTSPCSPLESES